jgi:hypothetical protein
MPLALIENMMRQIPYYSLIFLLFLLGYSKRRDNVFLWETQFLYIKKLQIISKLKNFQFKYYL